MNSEMLLDIAEGPSCLTTCLSVPEKTMMGPGPTNCTGRVLHSLSLPVLGHLHPETTKIMDDIKEGIRYMFQTKNQLTLALSASGHGGMEAVLCNLLEPGQRVLCGVTGIWSQRAAEMAKRYGAEVFLVEAHIGEALTHEQVRVSLDLHRPQVFFVTQGDSSTGVLQPIEGLADICHSYNCLLAVDTVASLGGTPMFADRWGVDAIYTGSQKVLGAPPGLAPISFSLAATAKIFARKTPVQVYYWDMTLLGDYWGCFDRPRIYHHTISATLLYGLREALAQACDEGLMSLWVRHNACAKLLYKGLQDLGIQLLVKDENVRLPTITTFLIPEGADVQRVTNFAMRYCSLEISGGLGPTAGNVFRIGLLGPNATEEKVDFALRVLKEALRQTKTSNL